MVIAMKSLILRLVLSLAMILPVGLALAGEKIALLSTSFVLERKFVLMAEVARAEGVDFHWAQVDRVSEDALRKMLEGARFVIVDAPRRDDRLQIERAAGPILAQGRLPVTNINVMSPPVRMTPANLEPATAQRIFDYYVAGTRTNHERMFRYIDA